MITLWLNGIAFKWKTDPDSPQTSDLSKPEYVTMCKMADRVIFQTPNAAFIRKAPDVELPSRKWNGDEWRIHPEDCRITLDGHRLRAQPEPITVRDKQVYDDMEKLMEKALDGRVPYGV